MACYRQVGLHPLLPLLVILFSCFLFSSGPHLASVMRNMREVARWNRAVQKRTAPAFSHGGRVSSCWWGAAPWFSCLPPLPRVTDEIFNFLLVWYYCTLTIRESILISNGSRYLVGLAGFGLGEPGEAHREIHPAG